jgi:hypothetical protein
MISGLTVPGRRSVCFELDPRSALDVWFHLQASLHSPATTRASRVHIAGLLPQLQRACVATGVVTDETCRQLIAALLADPAPPPIDDAVAALTKGLRL